MKFHRIFDITRVVKIKCTTSRRKTCHLTMKSTNLSFRDLIRFYLTAMSIKILLIGTYHSTDFEVHRNWLALTFSLPMSKWYFENRSEWTLDYPPFFAYFERFLAYFAQFVDAKMLQVENLNYKSAGTVLFQRWTVIFEFFYFFGAFLMVRSLSLPKTRQWFLFALITSIPGLLFVDHIHFQYNGFLYGIQLISLAAFCEQKYLVGGFLFAILLNFKHIYLYQAPAYFIFILSSFCFQRNSFVFTNLAKMGLIVMFVFGVSLVPFRTQIPQVLDRLFPFKRGLCHAYWAPNVWALYSFTDRVLLFVYKLMGNHIISTGHLTRGLVGDSTFSILPNITPTHTVILTLASQLV
jgi:alpha-1,3-glucosyltransferase